MKKIIYFFNLIIFGLLVASATETPTNRIYPVEVKSYLLSDKQLLDAGNFYAYNQKLSLEQWTFHQLKNKPTFIVIFAKNQGQAFVSGVLKGTIGNKTFELPVLGLPRDMEESAVWVVPVENVYLGEGATLPEIKLEWKEFSAV